MDRDKKSGAGGLSKVHRSTTKPLTTTAISALKPGKMLADGAIRPGAGSLKIRKRQITSGVVAEWIFQWHRAGKTVRQSIGRYSVAEVDGALTLAQARVEAAALQAVVRAGESPLHKREIEREAATVRQAAVVVAVREAKQKTLSAMLDAYVDSLRANGKSDSAYDAENMFGNHVKQPFPALAGLPAAEITAAHMTKILARLVGPEAKVKKGRTALKLRSYASAAFRLAMGASTDPMTHNTAASFGLTHNPAAAVSATKMAEVYARPSERALSVDELRHYLAHVAAVPASLPRLALQLQLATGGQRMQQLLRLRHSDISETTLTMLDPKGKRSQPRVHVLPIVPEIEEILSELRVINPIAPKAMDGLLFASRGAVVAPETLSGVVLEISDAMHALTAAMPFRGGDVRRTAETLLAGAPLSVSKDMRAQLLSHGIGGIQDSTYDKNLYLEEKRAVLRKWNDFMSDICIGKSDLAGNVVPSGKGKKAA